MALASARVFRKRGAPGGGVITGFGNFCSLALHQRRSAAVAASSYADERRVRRYRLGFGVRTDDTSLTIDGGAIRIVRKAQEKPYYSYINYMLFYQNGQLSILLSMGSQGT